MTRRKIGGARRDRTADPLLAKQVLSQLSYGPKWLVGLGGFEPPTSPLSGVRSNQLSYRPGVLNAPCRTGESTDRSNDQVICVSAYAQAGSSI